MENQTKEIQSVENIKKLLVDKWEKRKKRKGVITAARLCDWDSISWVIEELAWSKSTQYRNPISEFKYVELQYYQLVLVSTSICYPYVYSSVPVVVAMMILCSVGHSNICAIIVRYSFIFRK